MSISSLICVHKPRSITHLAAGMAAMLAFCTPSGVAQNSVSGAVHEPAQFAQTCSVCHGGDAQGTDRAPALKNSRQLRDASEQAIANVIKNGRGNMPAFSSFPDAQIQEL